MLNEISDVVLHQKGLRWGIAIDFQVHRHQSCKERIRDYPQCIFLLYYIKKNIFRNVFAYVINSGKLTAGCGGSFFFPQ